MTPPKLSPVWSADELEPALRGALELVDRLAPPDDLRVAVFNLAGSALLQRVVEQQPAAFALGALPRGLGRG